MSDSVRPHRRQPIRLPHPWDSPGKNTGVGCHFLLQCMKVKSESEVTQSGLNPRYIMGILSSSQSPSFPLPVLFPSLYSSPPSSFLNYTVLLTHAACSHLKNFSQFSSVTQSCPTHCDPMNSSTPGLPVHHQLPEFTQTHVHQISDAIQPSHPLSSPSPPAPNHTLGKKQTGRECNPTHQRIIGLKLY